VHNWTLTEKIRRTIAKFGGFYAIRLFWKISKHKKSRARAIILNHDKNQILLVKNITYKQFHLPGGGIEKGESGEYAVTREIKEELGIDISILYQLGKYKYNDTDKHVEVFVAHANTMNFQMQWELDRAEWFSFNNLPDLRKNTKQALRDFLAHNEPVIGIWGLDD